MADSLSVPVLSTTISILVGSFAAAVVIFLPRYLENLPSWIIPLITIIIIPLFAYLASISGSSIYQYGMCKKVNINSIGLGNIIILGLNAIVALLLFLENLPFKKYIFGEYAPINPLTGQSYPPESDEYKQNMESERHYKLQPLSSIVKVVLPVYYEESVKDGFAYMYWMFWATMLPSFFLFTIQGSSC